MKTMKKIRVLRTVTVSDDGLTGRIIAEGTEDQIDVALFEGLSKEGYVAEIEAKAPPKMPAPAPAPEDMAGGDPVLHPPRRGRRQ